MTSSKRCLSYLCYSYFNFIFLFICSYLIFIFSSLCGRLTVITPPSSTRICQSRNSKRQPPHMWMRISKPSGFNGGTPLLRSKKRTIFLRLSFFVRNTSTAGLIKFFRAQLQIQLSSLFVFSPHYFPFLTFLLSYNSWRRGSRPKSLHLKMKPPLTSSGDLQKIFCNPPIMLSIGGSFYGTRLSWCILTTKGSSNLLKALILWSLPKALAIKRVAHRYSFDFSLHCFNLLYIVFRQVVRLWWYGVEGGQSTQLGGFQFD